MEFDCKNLIFGFDNKCIVCMWIEFMFYFLIGDIFYIKINDCDFIFYLFV